VRGQQSRKMPFYRFLIHGEGEFRDGIKGFYATRCSRGANQETAAAQVMEIVRSDCEKLKLGQIAFLEVEETWSVNASEIDKPFDRGFTFYTDEDEDG
jgi:hypothetical protein